MKGAIQFAAGVATGWAIRSTVESSRDASVRLVSSALKVFDRARRLAAIERERIEDLLAEARALLDEQRARSEALEGGATPPARGANGSPEQPNFAASTESTT